MAAMFEVAFTQARGCIYGLVYCIDHQFLGDIIAKRAIDGLEVKLIFDQKNFRHSSCTRQLPLQKMLYDSGCQMKYLRPPGKSGWPSQHAKCFLIDHAIMLSGSVNLTYCGLEKNCEQLLWITEPCTIGDATVDFDRWWDMAEPVDEVCMNETVANWKLRMKKNKEELTLGDVCNPPKDSTTSSSSLPKDRQHPNWRKPPSLTAKKVVGGLP
jgi:phosphatidylserine/phosphatidylglycerophosphate/cardiolipin synthase-like enzyme